MSQCILLQNFTNDELKEINIKMKKIIGKINEDIF